MPDTMTPPAPVSAPPQPPGSTAPSTMPPRNAGMEASASVVMAHIATVINTRVLPNLDPMSDKGRTVRKVLDLITKDFGPASADLTRGAVKSMASAVPPMPPGPGAQPAAQKLGAMGLQPQPAQPPA